MFGFKNLIFITPKTVFVAQLKTHDDGQKRTKFDWHFSLRQTLLRNFALILGHDSNHDSDYQSIFKGKPFFINRNYFGFGLPYEFEGFYIEPFTWFLHHSNQRGHLDFSGNKIKQEYGLRMGVLMNNQMSLHFQTFFQSESLFSLGQSILTTLIFRIRLIKHLELSVGGVVWSDIQESRLGNKQKYHKWIWGIAVPF
jgi:hypothetical protein